MIPRNQQNRKIQINTTCPGCGMDLSRRGTQGCVRDDETYCCPGCADGTGCTCDDASVRRKQAGNRPGHPGQRRPGNSHPAGNLNEEINAAGKRIGLKKRATKKGPPRQQNRGQRLADGRKAPRSQSEERVSTRESARGRSDFRGSMNQRRVGRQGQVDRVTTTGTKGRSAPAGNI